MNEQLPIGQLLVFERDSFLGVPVGVVCVIIDHVVWSVDQYEAILAKSTVIMTPRGSLHISNSTLEWALRSKIVSLLDTDGSA